MRLWEEDQDVIVVYSEGNTRTGTIARCFPDRTYSVIFYDDDTADPHVPERCLRAAGEFMERTSRHGCD